MKIKLLKVFSLLLFSVLLTQTQSQAFTLFKKSINSIIRSAEVNRTSVVSISVKNLKNQKTVYKKKEKQLVVPASSLKMFTFASSLNTLGKDYEFKTSVFKDLKNNIYIKLGADPLLSASDIKKIANIIKGQEFNKIYIDDTIIDKVPYPDGWLTDDLWPNIPKISPYTLDRNMVKVKIKINPSKGVEIYQPNAYKFSFINNLTIGSEQNVKISKNYNDDNEIINIEGTIVEDTSLDIPVYNPKFYFIANLEEALRAQNIKYFDRYYFEKTPNNINELGHVSHNIEEVGSRILQNSDNFASEIVFKIAGGKFRNRDFGSTADGLKMFGDYYSNLGLNLKDVNVTDGSGVSRYNLLYADWMTDALVKIENTGIKSYMATPDVGSLSKRLRHMKGSLWAKTGTLNGISSIEGYIITKDKKYFAFVIIIQNFNKKSSVIKTLEDYLINNIYNM